METSNPIGTAPNFTTEGTFNAELFLKTLNNLRLKAEGCGVEVVSVRVTPSDRHEVIVHRV